jgi:Concanavalin A-like lectin/glucanases superfamily
MTNFGYKRSFLWSLFSLLLAAQSLAQQGTALHFDGVDDKLTASGNTLAVNTFTIEGWALPTATHTINAEAVSGITGHAGQKYMLVPPQAGSNSGVGISVGTNGVSVYEHGDNYLPCLLSWTGTITSWTHIAVVCVNKQYKLYINGNLVRTGLTSTRGNSLVYLSGGIGGGQYGAYQGSLDEFRVWNRALAPCELQNNLNCELGSVQTGLKTYFKSLLIE